MLIRAFLKNAESGAPQDARKGAFETFARRKGLRVAAYYNEQPERAHRSGLFQLLRDKGLAIASQNREPKKIDRQPKEELERLLKEARPGDVLLLEQARTFREIAGDHWASFRKMVKQRKTRLVALDVEASWVMVSGDAGMAVVAEQLTDLMLDMLELQSPPDGRSHRQRHRDGIARAKAQGKFKGRPVDQEKHARIEELLQAGNSWSDICRKTGVSRSTIARVVKSDA